ncbi:MAG: hypothetical protein K5650_00260 [Bacteroidales bacterium]|nr:hypothetical protein [Bacteroidales bacterium]
MKRRSLLILFVLPALWSPAQSNRWGLETYGTAGHNYAYGIYSRVAAIGSYNVGQNFVALAGLQCGTGASPMSGALGWYSSFNVGRFKFFVHNRYWLNMYWRYNIREMGALAEGGLSVGGWHMGIGLANRWIFPMQPVDRTGSTEYVFEPLNLVYAIEYKFNFTANRLWSATLRMASYDDFIIDRAYQPLLSLQVDRKVSDKVNLWARAVLRPTGIFSLSANYFEFFTSIGAHILW